MIVHATCPKKLCRLQEMCLYFQFKDKICPESHYIGDEFIDEEVREYGV